MFLSLRDLLVEETAVETVTVATTLDINLACPFFQGSYSFESSVYETETNIGYMIRVFGVSDHDFLVCPMADERNP